MKTELELAEEKVRELKRKQANCEHEWEDAFYDPFEREVIEYEYRWKGVDCFPVPVRTGIFKTVERYSRICKKCGKKESTTEIEPIIVGTKPKFR